MDQQELSKMLGVWTGVGTMTVGSDTGEVMEYLQLDTTDFPACLAYIRKSRITFGSRVSMHNEIGYMRTSDASLLLSRGSYIILPWDETEQAYVQAIGSPESRNMKRKVLYPSTDKMVWDNSMEVNVHGQWLSHTVKVEFTSVSNKTPKGSPFFEFDVWVPAGKTD